jgi:hypothetical protein
MKKKNNNIKTEYPFDSPFTRTHYHAFEAGDTIASYGEQDQRVVTEVVHNKDCNAFSCYYKFIQTSQTYEFKTLSSGIIESKKGSASQQPCHIVDKYFCLIYKKKGVSKMITKEDKGE